MQSVNGSELTSTHPVCLQAVLLGNNVPPAAGYFHAPGALLCPLGKTAQQYYQPGPALPSVCIVFCAMEGFEAMQVKSMLIRDVHHVHQHAT